MSLVASYWCTRLWVQRFYHTEYHTELAGRRRCEGLFRIINVKPGRRHATLELETMKSTAMNREA